MLERYQEVHHHDSVAGTGRNEVSVRKDDELVQLLRGGRKHGYQDRNLLTLGKATERLKNHLRQKDPEVDAVRVTAWNLMRNPEGNTVGKMRFEEGMTVWTSTVVVDGGVKMARTRALVHGMTNRPTAI